jgi:hypothetical protein
VLFWIDGEVWGGILYLGGEFGCRMHENCDIARNKLHRLPAGF